MSGSRSRAWPAIGPLLLAVVALLTSSCGVSFYDLPVERSVRGDSYPVTAVFTDASNLPRGGEVKLGQATVGYVREITARDFRAQVGMDLEPGVRLPVGTAARLNQTTALGEQYVDLQPPPNAEGEPELGPNSVIGLPQTSRGPDVENTLAVLGGVLNGSGIDQARTVLSELHTTMDGRGQQVRGLLQRLDGQLAVLDRRGAEIDATIDSVNQVAAETAANRPVLEEAVDEITPAVEHLASQRGEFERLLGDVAELGDSADGIVRQAGPQVADQLEQLRPVVDSFDGYDRRMSGLLSSLHEVEQRVGSAIPGDYLNLDGTLDVSGTLLPLLTGGAPPPVPGSGPLGELGEPGGPGELLTGGTR
jgi:phospholipid/cholesterol/gamma-HCH transport system substrate-binding protein